MNVHTRSSSLQAYQVVLYNRALHPELFELKERRVIEHGGYELELWLMPGTHLLRFGHGDLCACELVTDREDNLPSTGVVTAFFCAGERDYEHRFNKEEVTYMTTVQTETLPENLYHSTFREMMRHANDQGSIVHEWADEVGPNLSLVDVQRFTREIHVQAYHLLASLGFVLRTQTIFEHK